ncbi:MAG: hypothetical protein COY66_02570 [Candidatus Kerfeldbacteria bacterium CG_4_10_14_0_8_um_filter_42_10]|uniref:Uncharacterized protein n=1 Tax=Candidatus Kerfeldbacteria bacterium CG_4_10_14_0_8_um_filter_42_10 TaxID=2014248 RepID=A0A2M7RJI1_9BACT|nr:MAG: hypothetical protein COY66_02570 [Candidatus Kerfeldbacteria bacterium CG_4_10_14_0_8_um_filter_42_10]
MQNDCPFYFKIANNAEVIERRQKKEKGTTMANLKRRRFGSLQPGSAAHVIEHARVRASRGRVPSLPYLGVGNPRKALALAQSGATAPPDPKNHFQTSEHRVTTDGSLDQFLADLGKRVKVRKEVLPLLKLVFGAVPPNGTIPPGTEYNFTLLQWKGRGSRVSNNQVRSGAIHELNIQEPLVGVAAYVAKLLSRRELTKMGLEKVIVMHPPVSFSGFGDAQLLIGLDASSRSGLILDVFVGEPSNSWNASNTGFLFLGSSTNG